MATNIWILVVCLSVIYAVTEGKIEDAGDAIAYLMRFNYMKQQDPRTGALVSEEGMRQSIMDFQQFANIPATGVLDDETMKMMNMPRCGVADVIGNGLKARKRRYAAQGSRWQKTDLTYRVSKYTSQLSRDEVDKEIARAFQVWADVTPLTFTKKSYGSVDIDIQFASGSHGDGNPFDGRGKTLAHAFFPQFGGDSHFDDSEVWTLETYQGTNLFQVAAHEFGHALGLSHSDMKDALMAPFYRGFVPNFKLPLDDRMGIQRLYGKPRNTPRPTQPTEGTTRKPMTVAPGMPNICNQANFNIDAVTTTKDGMTYFFQGAYYWQVTGDGVTPGYPRLIKDDWPGLPNSIDAALKWDNGNNFFFKGDQYWKFINKNLQNGYPRLIKTGFPGVPDDIEAAFVWSGNSKTYFVKNGQYWRYTNGRADSGYPRPLRVWKGIPSSRPLSDVFQWTNGRTYFFEGDRYYRFDDQEFNVDTTSRTPYPRPTKQWWFDCKTSNVADGTSIDRMDPNKPNPMDQGTDESQWVMVGGNTTSTRSTMVTTPSGYNNSNKSLPSLVLVVCLAMLKMLL